MRGRAGKAATTVLVAVIALGGLAVDRAAAELDEHEYDLLLPEPSGAGGEVGPAGETGAEDGTGEESATTAEQATTTPASVPAESAAETPASDSTAGRSGKSEDRPDGPRYPRGETYALGPAEQAGAGPTDPASGDGKPGLAIAVIAGLSGILVAVGAWRMRAHSLDSRG